MGKKRSFVAKEVDGKEYEDIIQKLSSITDTIDSTADRLHMFALLKGIVVSYCQPDITIKRIGKMLEFVGLDNLEVLSFIDDLKKTKERIDKKRPPCQIELIR